MALAKKERALVRRQQPNQTTSQGVSILNARITLLQGKPYTKKFDKLKRILCNIPTSALKGQKSRALKKNRSPGGPEV